MFAQIVVPVQSFQSFTYLVPGELESTIKEGSFVTVPFRRETMTGVVVETSARSNYQGAVKTIASLKPDMQALPADLWSTLQWASRYYLTPLGMVLKTALPLGFSDFSGVRQHSFVKITAAGRDALAGWSQKAPVQREVLERLQTETEPMAVRDLAEISLSSAAACKRLEQMGFAELSVRDIVHNPFDQLAPEADRPITLTPEQTAIYGQIEEQINAHRFAPFLLQGVTGSGKTEVYLQAARRVLDAGGSVLLLLPEIALTPQVAIRFQAAFGDQVALWHSRLTPAEKAWTWQNLLKGRFSVVVGARSAVFAPLQNLRLVIVDEEQESSYKQDDPAPRYQARDLALVRARQADAVVILSSATPSSETYFNAISGRYRHVHLAERFGGAVYPLVHLVDMKLESRKADRYPLIFSPPLIDAIAKRLAADEQIILLQNRRGFAPVSSCSECGHEIECPNCAVLLTFHKSRHLLQCHYCGHTATPPEACSQCGSPHIFLHGIGTEKVEEELLEIFPDAAVVRMDSDTTRGRNAHHRMLSEFGAGRYQILLGTQMIAKGLDFSNVTLVGVINADTGLAIPDFRAGERTFQLVYQVCGRAGRRKEKPGEAVIQSYHPKDAAVQAAAHLDANLFYNQLLAERRELNYPPFSRVARIILQGKDQARVWDYAREVQKRLTPLPAGVRLLGPAAAPFERLKGQWRVHLMLQADRQKDPVGNHMRHRIVTAIPRTWMGKSRKGVRLKIDVDPASLL